MNVKFKINNKLVTYTEDELKLMSREELKGIKRELQANIEEVSAKRATYNATNKESQGSKEYYAKIASYKTVVANLKKSIAYIGSIIQDSRESELSKREHWLWSFYKEVKEHSWKGKFNKFVELADERAKYHVEIGE